MDLHAHRLGRLGFVYPWRTYQRLMLSRIEQLIREQRTLHLVSPPGSGKTIVGLEVARRNAGPAVVFAPTTTIASQWADKVSLFTDDDELRHELCSNDPTALSTLNVFTYQRISTQDTTDQSLEAAACDEWLEQLVVDGQAADAAAAKVRVERMRTANPDRYRRQVRSRTRRLRRRLIDDGGDVERFLHPNALALLDELEAAGLRTIVLDECHHLLDHWAIVIRALIDRCPDATVVGMTATLPDPDDRTSYENYTGLLGDVDFEVPTPAVVKEGDLAPWRDLVYVVSPTRSEQRVLRRADRAFVTSVTPLLDQDRLHGWASAALFDPASEEPTASEDPGAEGPPAAGPADVLAERLVAEPLLSLAQGRLLHAAGRWPDDVPAPPELREPITFDDKLAVIERYGLDELALSDDPADHERLAELRQALQGFGLSLTERGLRQGRSVGDLVLALSAAKDDAVVDILTREAADLGDRLRAVVITDFATRTVATARAPDVLDDDAGSAFRAFHALIDDPATDALDPMLVTGSTLLVDADHGEQLLHALNDQLAEDRLDARCRYHATGHPQVLEVLGDGPDWSPATYVRLVTEVLESGATRCLVGTRGLFGEGWDALTLNTLIDLTAVTTSTGVEQLRGRSIRIDPAWEHKVAHNWDVVCVAEDHPRGDADLGRLVRRHSRSWGVVPPVPITDRLKATRNTLRVGDPVAPAAIAAGGAEPGWITRGISHVSPLLAWQLATGPLETVAFDVHTAASLRAIGDRDASYRLWGVGSDYDNFITRATVLDVSESRVRTVHAIRDSLVALVRRFSTMVGSGVFLGASTAYYAGGSSWLALLVGMVVGAMVGVVVVLAANRRDVLALARALFVEQPPDAILRDVGRSVLEAYQASGLIDRGLEPEFLRVVQTPDGQLRMTLDHASEADADAISAAVRQVFDPVVDQRYLIWRTDDRLPSVPLQALWGPIRRVTRSHIGAPSYHPVPDVLGINRERADHLAEAWARNVGGGELVYTRSPEGRRLLLEARAGTRRAARSYAFERWR